MQVVFIGRQSHPEVKDVTQKDHVTRAAFQGRQHSEEPIGTPGLADVRIGDQHQMRAVVGWRILGAARFWIHPVPSIVGRDAAQGFSSSDPRISSVSIHITLIIPNAQASSTPSIQEKYHIFP